MMGSSLALPKVSGWCCCCCFCLLWFRILVRQKHYGKWWWSTRYEVSLICRLQIQCNHLHNTRKVGLGLEGDCGQKVKIGSCSCSDDTTARAAGMCTKRSGSCKLKDQQTEPLGYCLAERTGFLIGRVLRTVVMVWWWRWPRKIGALSMFERYNKSIYNVVGSCMMWWFIKFEWLAYGDESLLCTVLHVYSTALSNFFLLLLHSESMRKIPTMRFCYCFLFVEYVSSDVGFYLLPSHVSEMLW